MTPHQAMEMWAMIRWGKTPSEFYDLPEYDRRMMVDYAYHRKKVLEDTINQSKKSVKKKGEIFGKPVPNPEIVKMVLPLLLEMR